MQEKLENKTLLDCLHTYIHMYYISEEINNTTLFTYIPLAKPQVATE
jgi:hypothetical protein